MLSSQPLKNNSMHHTISNDLSGIKKCCLRIAPILFVELFSVNKITVSLTKENNWESIF